MLITLIVSCTEEHMVLITRSSVFFFYLSEKMICLGFVYKKRFLSFKLFIPMKSTTFSLLQRAVCCQSTYQCYRGVTGPIGSHIAVRKRADCGQVSLLQPISIKAQSERLTGMAENL